MIASRLAGLRRVLCIGAHSDDIEIGCGGTVLRIAAESPGVEFLWVVLCADGQRAGEARRSAAAFLRGVRRKSVEVHPFRDGYLPYLGPPVKDCFEDMKRRFEPDLIFTHYRRDFHQDHRLIADLTWNTFRDHAILEYEIPKYDADLGSPNVFVPVSAAVCRRKVKYLMTHFGTQRRRDWFTEDLFMSVLRLRGVESRSPTRFAEAFHSRKAVLSFG